MYISYKHIHTCIYIYINMCVYISIHINAYTYDRPYNQIFSM